MAGSWLKIEIETPDKPEVWAIADYLEIDPDAVFGKLFRVWSWFDTHSEKGNAPSVTKSLLNRTVGVTNFCDALISVGWMLEQNGEIVLTNFDRHNGETAKTRALAAKRASKRRNADRHAKVTLTALPREEKRRDKRNSANSAANSAAFEAFWAAYPKKKNKGQAENAFRKLNPDPDLLTLILSGIEKAKRTEGWRKQDGQFIPYPATWLNAQGWLDEDSTAQKGPLPKNARIAV